VAEGGGLLSASALFFSSPSKSQLLPLLRMSNRLLIRAVPRWSVFSGSVCHQFCHQRGQVTRDSPTLDPLYPMRLVRAPSYDTSRNHTMFWASVS